MFKKLMRFPFVFFIRVYQIFISPFLGINCRFNPSCSSYAIEAMTRHKLGTAFFLITKRLSRCHPWGASGYDPVPEPIGQHKEK